MEDLNYSGMTVTTDNFFTSFELSQDLLKKRIKIVGTMRNNRRELPLNMLPSKTRELHSSIFACSSQTLLSSYVPSKEKAITLLSTKHKSFVTLDDEKKKNRSYYLLQFFQVWC